MPEGPAGAAIAEAAPLPGVSSGAGTDLRRLCGGRCRTRVGMMARRQLYGPVLSQAGTPVEDAMMAKIVAGSAVWLGDVAKLAADWRSAAGTGGQRGVYHA